MPSGNSAEKTLRTCYSLLTFSQETFTLIYGESELRADCLREPEMNRFFRGPSNILSSVMGIHLPIACCLRKAAGLH